MGKDSDIIIGYAGKCYSILDLRERAKEYRYGENISVKELFESKFNNPNESSLDGEVWVRLTQKGWNSYFVSNFGRVRWINNENKIIKDILKGVEKENYEVILDRKIAINKGLNLLNKNDISDDDRKLISILQDGESGVSTNNLRDAVKYYYENCI